MLRHIMRHVHRVGSQPWKTMEPLPTFFSLLFDNVENCDRFIYVSI
jgi:hypothetical protein